jgi:hypothetical protein
VLCYAGSGLSREFRGDLLDPASLILEVLQRNAVVARPTTAFLFLVASMVFAATPAVAADPPELATPPVSGNVEVGLSEEASRFTQIRIGDSPVILIPGDKVRQNETFRHLGATVNASVPCGIANLNCVGDLNYDTHIGLRTGDVDTDVLQGDAGVQYGMGTSVYGVKLAKERWKVGGQEFRRIDGVALDWVAAVTDQLASYVLINVLRYRHPGDTSVLDANYRAITGNLRWGSKDRWQSAYTVQATLSREDNVQDDPTADVKGVLVRLAWDSKPAEGWELGVSGIIQRLSFAEFDPALDVRRVDTYTGADIQIARRIIKNLNVRLDLGYAYYRSSAVAFNNDWASIGAMVIWKF